MKTLFILDEKNYTNDMLAIERYAVRAIIKKNNLFAMQLSKDGEYKIPGGGIEQGESHIETLIREVKEETGLVVNPKTITEIGVVKEIRRDILCQTKKFIQHSFYYTCEIFEETVETNMTDHELSKDYKLVWETAQKIYNSNMKLMDSPWKVRDTRFFELFVDHTITL